MRTCDACGQEVNGWSILGIMPDDKIEGRKPANICARCMDASPCNQEKGSWLDGQLACKHGFCYTIDYFWQGERAMLMFDPAGRKWWSRLMMSNHRHNRMILGTQ